MQIAESLEHAKENFARVVQSRSPSSEESEQAQLSRSRSVKVGPATLESSPSTAESNERITKHFLKKRKASSEEATGRTQAKHLRGVDR
jgi:hypothetical protein